MNRYHTHSSQLFRSECNLLPGHSMHLLGRFKVHSYLLGTHKTAAKHAHRIAVALEHMEAIK